MTKGEAKQRQMEFMKQVNGGEGGKYGPRLITLGEFVEEYYLPFYRGKWKKSTRLTNENRFQYHLVQELGRQWTCPDF
jgi:hypothetical protein